MYKINNQLSNSFQGLFQIRESKHHLRRTFVFKKKFIWTNSKYLHHNQRSECMEHRYGTAAVKRWNHVQQWENLKDYLKILRRGLEVIVLYTGSLVHIF